MSESNLLEITEMASTQEERSVTFNEALAKLEAGAGLFPALDVNLNTPPGGPAEGDVYVLGAAPTGAWSGHGTDIALYYNASWRFMPARSGLLAYAVNEDAYYRFKTGYGWELLITAGDPITATQTDFLSAFLETPTDKTIYLVINSPIAFTVTATTTKAASGSATYTFDINGTPLGGSANAVTSSEQTQNHASANVVSVGGDLKLTIANDSPAAEDVAVTVKYTYELA